LFTPGFEQHFFKAKPPRNNTTFKGLLRWTGYVAWTGNEYTTLVESPLRHQLKNREGCDDRIKIRPAAAELFHVDTHEEASPKNSSTTAHCSWDNPYAEFL
jgi:hypothetical protein